MRFSNLPTGRSNFVSFAKCISVNSPNNQIIFNITEFSESDDMGLIHNIIDTLKEQNMETELRKTDPISIIIKNKNYNIKPGETYIVVILFTNPASPRELPSLEILYFDPDKSSYISLALNKFISAPDRWVGKKRKISP